LTDSIQEVEAEQEDEIDTIPNFGSGSNPSLDDKSNLLKIKNEGETKKSSTLTTKNQLDIISAEECY